MNKIDQLSYTFACRKIILRGTDIEYTLSIPAINEVEARKIIEERILLPGTVITLIGVQGELK